MVPTFLISVYRFLFKARFSAVTYLLNPSCRFYFTFVVRLIFTFLVLIVVVWTPLMLDIGDYVTSGKGFSTQLLAITSVFDYFYYFLFSAAEDSSDAVNAYLEPDGPHPDPISMSMAAYQANLFDMDSDFDNLKEEWEANGKPTYLATIEGGKYLKRSAQAELFSGPPLLHVAQNSDLVDEFPGMLRSDYRFDLNRLSSIERVYRSGFFDYGYDYDSAPGALIEKKGFSISPISETDFNFEGSDAIFDDILTVELSRRDKAERVIIAAMDNSILNIDNPDLSFIKYANEYSQDVYEDILQPNVRASQGTGGLRR